MSDENDVPDIQRSTLLGANHLQSSLDHLKTSVDNLAGQVKASISAGVAGLRAGWRGLPATVNGASPATSSVTPVPMLGSGIPNGGGATFGGPTTASAITVPKAAGTPQATAATQSSSGFGGGTPNGGGGTFAPLSGGGMSATGIAALAAGAGATAGQSVGSVTSSLKGLLTYASNGGTSADEMTQAQTLLGSIPFMYTYGGYAPRARNMFSRGAFGPVDYATSYMALAQTYGNSSPYMYQAAAGAAQFSASNPSVGAADASAAYLGLGSMQTGNTLRMFGVNTYKAGAQLDPAEIARQIAGRSGLLNRSLNGDQINFLAAPNSTFQSNLRGMGLDPSTAVKVTQLTQQMLTAQNSGMSFTDFNRFMSNSESSDPQVAYDARKQLLAAGVQTFGSNIQHLKDQGATSTDAAFQTLTQFNASLNETTQLLGNLNTELGKIPGVRQFGALNRGSGGTLGAVLGAPFKVLSGMPGASMLGGIFGGVPTGAEAGDGSTGSTSAGSLGSSTAGSFGAGDASLGMVTGMGVGYSEAAQYGMYSEAAALYSGSAATGVVAPSSGNGTAPSSGGSPSVPGTGNSTPGNTGFPSPSTPGSGAGGAGIVAEAKKHLNVPYVWGGESLSGWDCSGMVYWVLNHCGIRVPRTTAAGFAGMGSPAGSNIGALQLGDLVFFGSPVHHVGIYAGGGQMVSASNPSAGTEITGVASFHSASGGFVFARRMVKGGVTRPVDTNEHKQGNGATTVMPPAPTGPHPGGTQPEPAPSTPLPTPTGSGSVTGHKKYAQSMLAMYGWDNATQWKALDALWTRESGWNPYADNPTSSAYGIPQALVSAHYPMPRGYYDRYSGDPHGSSFHGYGGSAAIQIQWGLNYIKSRYGSPASAWHHETSIGWYDKGSWEIPEDETARIHKGEMIVPAGEARTIRSVLLQAAGVGAGKSGGGEGVTLSFNPGSIVLHIGAGASPGMGKSLAGEFATALATHDKIKTLQAGR